MRTEDEIKAAIAFWELERVYIVKDLNPLDTEVVKRNAKLALLRYQERMDTLKWVLGEKDSI